MQDLTEAYFSIYENYDDLNEETRREYLQKKFNRQNRQNPGSAHKHIPGKQNTGAALQAAIKSERHMRGDVDEGRAFSGGPDLAHTFPNKNKKKAVQIIRDLRKTIEAEIANASQTRSARKPEQQGGRRPTTNLDNVRIGESHDFYDLVLDYLLDEGYADTEENAISMMSAMSEDWINSIIG